MGRFKIEITAVGGHGDRREVKDGEALDFEGLPLTSVDRVAWEATQELKARGCSIESATITHWPGQTSEVVDDVLTQIRKGSF